MRLKELNYIVELIRNHPGKYTPADVIKKLRLYAIETGSGDPGLAYARNYLSKAIKTNKICIRDRKTCFGVKIRNRCYPK